MKTKLILPSPSHEFPASPVHHIPHPCPDRLAHRRKIPKFHTRNYGGSGIWGNDSDPVAAAGSMEKKEGSQDLTPETIVKSELPGLTIVKRNSMQMNA